MENKVLICNTKESKIDNENNVANTFFSSSNKIRIPLFQRGYKWGENLIKIFINDITKHFINNPNERYFIGTIVSMNKSDSAFPSKVIVDGQQRITTLSLAKSIFEINLANSWDDLKLEMLYTSLPNKNSRWEKGMTPDPIEKLLEIFNSININDEENFIKLKEYLIEEINKDEKLSIFQKTVENIISENEDSINSLWISDIESKIIFANVVGEEEIIGRLYENINFKLLPLTSFELFKNKLFLKNLSLNSPIEENVINGKILNLINVADILMKASNTNHKGNRYEDFLRLVLMIITNSKIPAADNHNIVNFYEKLNEIEDNYWNDSKSFLIFFNKLNKIVDDIEGISNFALKSNTDDSFIVNTIIRSSYVSVFNLIKFWNNSEFSRTELKKFFKWMFNEVVSMESRYNGKNHYDFQLTLHENYSNSNEVELNSLFETNFASRDWYNAKGYFDRAALLIYEKSKKSNGARSNKLICDAIRDATNINIEHIHPRKPEIKDEDDKKKYVNFEFMESNKNKIGNLTILEKLENGLAGNEIFQVKKKEYYNSSKFSVSKLKNWNQKIFESRSKEILESVLAYFS